MRSPILLTALILGLPAMLHAQVYPVSTVMKNGDDTNRINFVILPDGFTSAELSGFATSAADQNTYLFNETPFKEYRSFFNTYRVDVPSAQSGASHPATATDVSEPVFPVASVSTAFGCSFDVSNIHRLLVPNDVAAALNVLNANVPAWDQGLVLSNSPYYGGSGGGLATSSLHTASNEIVAHELGHSFGYLADEYWTNGYEAPNETHQSDPNLVKWKNWLGVNGIGIYPYGSMPPSSTWYRPHALCKMQFLGQPYCSVCREAIINRIYTLVTPVDQFKPDTSATLSMTAPMKFVLTLVKPSPNTIMVQWKLNNAALANTTDSVQLNAAQLQKGDNILTAYITDTTNLSRSYLPAAGYQFTVSWKLHKDSATVITDIASGGRFFYRLYPVPSGNTLYLSYDNHTAAGSLDCNIFAMTGQLVREMQLPLSPGQQTAELDISGLIPGNYLCRFSGQGVYFEAQISRQ